MYTDAELAFYAAGCLTRQPGYEPGHPEIDLFDAMANPPEGAANQPSWFPEEEQS